MFELNWPPPGLGLEKANPKRLADAGYVGVAVAAAVGFTLLGLGVDAAFFNGVTLSKLRSLDSMPWPARAGLVLFSTLVEELLYRFTVMTLVAWAIVRVDASQQGKAWVMWTSIGLSAVLFAGAYAGNLPNVPNPLLRAL